MNGLGRASSALSARLRPEAVHEGSPGSLHFTDVDNHSSFLKSPAIRCDYMSWSYMILVVPPQETILKGVLSWHARLFVLVITSMNTSMPCRSLPPYDWTAHGNSRRNSIVCLPQSIVLKRGGFCFDSGVPKHCSHLKHFGSSR